MIEQFWDEDGGGFFFTGEDHEALITRSKDYYDNATPSGNSVATHVLLRLALLTGEVRYRHLAERTLRLLAPAVRRAPSAFGHLLCALDLDLASPYEIAIVGPPGAAETEALVETVFTRYLPNKVVAFAAPGDDEAGRAIRLLEGRGTLDQRTTAYVCRNYYCEAPVTEVAALQAQL
jgi:uncharacterized protein YyaL (SSP411 family)